MTTTRALTVQQPWAWAIIHGGKTIENRTQNWTHRGPLLIHAGARLSDRGLDSPLLQDTHQARTGGPARVSGWVFSAIIGVVDLVDVHPAEPQCCDSPWAEQSYTEHGGRVRRQITHLVLENPQPIDPPIACPGRLGLWTPTHDILEQLR